MRSRSLPIVKLLVQHQVNLNQQNRLQEPLQTMMMAYNLRQQEIAFYLAEEGTDMVFLFIFLLKTHFLLRGITLNCNNLIKVYILD